MPEKVKMGIIGVGQIGKMHLDRYKDLPVEFVAAADIDKPELKRVAKAYDIPSTFTDFRELLAMDEIAAVDVCLHNNLHSPVTIAALEAGKHVYCEKPIAGTYVDGKAMVETAKKCDRMLSIQLATLFSAETRGTQRLIEEGHLGDLYFAKSVSYRRRGRPYVDGYGTESFVQKKVAAGGALFDMGVYHIAQVLYLLDNPEIQTVSGATHQATGMYADRRKKSGYDVEELGLGFVRLAGGITMTVEESWALHVDQGSHGSQIFGSRGGVRLDPFAYFTTIGDMEMDGTFDLKQADWRWHQCIADTDAYDGPQAHWVAALQGRVPLIDTAGLALATMKISQGIFLSTELGREVTADEIDAKSKSTAVEL
jgi:predicted dehydrogenase